MLRVGLTGGIGSGKSTVARRLVERGAALVDSDVLAREVVAPGTDGLAEVVTAFGPDVLDADGALDRPGLAAIVFSDPAARERLNRIVHPRVRRRSAELIAAARPDEVVVQDVPLLVEGGMAASFPLVVVVHADEDERVRRLVTLRGLSEDDARARIAAQADDDLRRAAADVWLDNSGARGRIAAAVDALWRDRLVGFEENLRRRVGVRGGAAVVRPDPTWVAQGARLAARVAAAAGERGRGVAHVGPTAVPGRAAADVVDLQLGVASAADAEAVREALADAGFPALDEPAAGGWSGGHPVDPAAGTSWPARSHASADPGRPAHVQVIQVGSTPWRRALLLRDWLRAGPAAHEVGPADRGDPAALGRAEEWAGTSGWTPSLL